MTDSPRATGSQGGDGPLIRRLQAAVEAFSHIGTRARWIALVVSTACGWVGLAIWLAAMHGHFEGDEGGNGSGVWSMMLICGLVGTCQALAVLTAPADRRLLRKGRWILLLVLHAAVVSILAVLIVPSGARFDGAMDVLLLGGFGWVLVPLILAVVAGIMAMVIGLVSSAAGEFEQAARPRSVVPTSRLLAISSGIALLGVAGALVFWSAAVPTFGTAGGGRGAGIAIIVLLFLEAVQLLPGPRGWLFSVDRIGYLISVLAALQWLVVAPVVRARGRAEVQLAQRADRR